MKLDAYCLAVSRDCRLTSTDRSVLWAMKTYVNWETRETFVSADTLGVDVCLHRDQVRRALRNLEDYGVVTARPRAGQSTVYRFPLGPELTDTPRESTRGRSRVSTRRKTVHTPRESTRGDYPQPRVEDVHTPRGMPENPAWGHAPNFLITTEEERAREVFADPTPAVPASSRRIFVSPIEAEAAAMIGTGS